jgi:uncharacterized protein (DUF736 family)
METKNNSGAIFKNDNKKSENHPDYKGKVNVNGKDMEVALWLKESSKGTKYFSASFSEPYIKTDEPQNQGREALKKTIIHESNFDNDDLPF